MMYAIDEPKNNAAGIVPAGRPNRFLSSPLWPAVGTALLWAARELLPEILGVLQTANARREVLVEPVDFDAPRDGLSSNEFARRQRGWRHGRGGGRQYT